MANEKAKEISLGKDFGDVAVKVNGISLEVSWDGKSVKIISDTPVEISYAANVNKVSTAIATARKALKVGDHLQDGTVVIAVDLNNNKAMLAPEGIFGGNSKFDHQDDVVKQANAQSLHGNKDWRRITDKEASAFASAWDKIAPPALQGNAALWFWGASPYYDAGRVYRGGDYDWNGGYVDDTRPVPVVRIGPARS